MAASPRVALSGGVRSSSIRAIGTGIFALACGLGLLVGVLFFGLRFYGAGVGPETGLWLASAFLGVGAALFLGGVYYLRGATSASGPLTAPGTTKTPSAELLRPRSR